jgi:hypothetical protein
MKDLVHYAMAKDYSCMNLAHVLPILHSCYIHRMFLVAAVEAVLVSPTVSFARSNIPILNDYIQTFQYQPVVKYLLLEVG